LLHRSPKRESKRHPPPKTNLEGHTMVMSLSEKREKIIKWINSK